MIAADNLTLLIGLGRVADEDEEARSPYLNALRGLGSLNRLRPEEWSSATYALAECDLVLLIKGLTIAEAFCPGWAAGSVSAVIWTFRELAERSPDLAEMLPGWIRQRTRNRWVPFGTARCAAHSLSGYRRWLKQDHERQALAMQSQKVRELAADERKRIRSEQRLRAARDRKTVVRTEFLRRLAALPMEEQLRQLATDSYYPVEFYPTCIAGGASTEILQGLDERTRAQLSEKLEGCRRGPWASFRRRLNSCR